MALAAAGGGCAAASDAARPDDLLKAAVSAHGRTRIEATDAVLTMAERLAEVGQAAPAERIYRTLWDASGAPAHRHVRCAAIRGLARVLGPAAVDDLAAAMAGRDGQVAASAMQAAARVPGQDVTRAWVERLASAPAVVRPRIVRILGRRGGPAAAEAVLAALGSDQDAVRRAAIEAAGGLATPHAVRALIGLLEAEDSGDRAAAEAALARLQGPGVSAAVAAHLPEARPAVRVRLIQVLSARAARDQADAVAACLEGGAVGVQTAALKALAVLGGEAHVPAILDALVAAGNEGVRRSAARALVSIGPGAEAGRFVPRVVGAMEKAGPEARCALLRVLSAAATPRGLSAVRQALGAGEEAVRETAVRVLADWPGTAAAADLLAIARGAEETKHRVLALRGYIRLAGREEKVAERTRMVGRALSAAERVEERRLALAALAEVPTPEALRLALAHMEEASLRSEAAAAVLGIAEGIAAEHPADARAGLEAVLRAVEAGRLRQRAERLLERLREGGR